MIERTVRRTNRPLGGCAFLLIALIAAPASAQCYDLDPCCYEPAKTLFSWNHHCPPSSGGGDTIATDRPDFTEASSTVGRGRIQFEMGYTYTWDDDGVTSLREHSLPELLIRIGLLAEWLEFRVGGNFLDETTFAGGGRTNASGGDDLYLGIKLALTEQCGWLPEMAILPQTSAPIGDVAFSANEFLPGINWLYSWEINDWLSTAGSTQINRAREPGDVAYTELAQSWTVGASLTERLGSYFEWYAFFPHAAPAGTTSEHYLNGGFTWLATDNWQFDIRAGFGLNEAADDYFLGSGMSVRF